MAHEFSAEEAVGLLTEAMVICASFAGNPQHPFVAERVKAFQTRLMEMMLDPSRRVVRCATCGQKRSDMAELPDDGTGYVIAAQSAADANA